MKTRIIVDSTADVSARIKGALAVVPLTIHFGDQEYIDGVTITHTQFYEKLIESDTLPKTSQPTPDAFSQVFEQVRRAGEQAVVLTVSQKLSGTYQSAMIAARDYADIVHVVDSKSVAIGTGILAELALQLADGGMDAGAIAARLRVEREHVRVVAMLDTLEYLKRGGRLSRSAAIAGEMLSIKPVVGLQEGEIAILGKARGSRRANNLLVKQIEDGNGVDFSKPLLLGYTGLSSVLLDKYRADSAFLWENSVSQLESILIGSTIGTHAGPGAVAVAFFEKQ